jgi:hypothetical protein
MALSQSLQVQEKKELATKEEKTVPARYYVPNADIYENGECLGRGYGGAGGGER